MRTSCLFVLSLAGSLTAPAQIPNAGFEDWSAPNGFDDPDGWMTNNGFTFQYDLLACEPGQPGHLGNFYVALTSQTIPGLSVMPASAVTGDFSTGVEGFPYDQRPAELNGWWQHQSTGLDEGMVAVTFTKWNPDLLQREDIGAGYLMTNGNIAPWQPFSVPIFYVSPDYPDTATITLASSASGLLTAGSTLFVDDLAFDSSTGVDEPSTASLQVHLAGAGDQLILNTRSAVTEMALLTADGRQAQRMGPVASGTPVDLSTFPAGCYLAVLRLADGMVCSARFVKP